MQHARALIESRPFLTRVPDDEVLVTGSVPTSMPGAGRYHFAATRDAGGSYAMSCTGRPAVCGPDEQDQWDERHRVVVRPADWPRDGDRHVSEYGRTHVHAAGSRRNDVWVLVLDDASKRFGAPGATSR
jgi:hypothetical protein